MKARKISFALFMQFALLFTSGIVFGQENKLQFGDVDDEILKMKSYVKDTMATAVVIGDFGDIRFVYNEQKNCFEIVYDRFTRIKILKKEGFQSADHMVKLYSSNYIYERIGKVRGTTYNLINGKVQKSNLSNKAVFTEMINDNWRSVKFSMPNIMEGSVIEFKYTITSNYLFNLPVWYFQSNIPVLWSEINVEIPEYYTYKQFLTGFHPIQINEQGRGNGSIILTNNVTTMVRNAATTEIQRDEIKYFTNKYRMVAWDVPQFVSEPMLTTKENYILKNKFELSSENLPGVEQRLYSRTWQSIIKDLMEDPSFGQQLSGGLFLNDKINEAKASNEDQIHLMIVCYEYIKNTMKWNGINSIYSSSLRNAYQYRTGSTGDINLLLTLMLKKAGFDAYPVILSTRSNGIINTQYPLLSSFNYVISMVKHGGEIYLLDATDQFSSSNLLPERCLNGQGLVVDKSVNGWVDLNPKGAYNYSSELSLVMQDNGDTKGSIATERADYAAYKFRENLYNSKNEEEYIEELENNNQGLEIESHEYENIGDVYKPVIERYEVKITGKADLTNDHIYFNPMFFNRMESNPFKLKERLYPIDFAYPRHDSFKLTLEIPEGYIIEELPENESIDLKGGSAVFSYNIESIDNKVVLNTALHINETLYLDTDYKELQSFYNSIVKKHNEIVTLKKQ